MARNRSLDDFIDAQSGSDSPDSGSPDSDSSGTDLSDSEPAGSAPDADAESDPDADMSDAAPDEGLQATAGGAPAAGLDAGPATTTMAWDPDGAACEACGTVVERRWRDDDGLVCEGCKEW